MTKTTTPNPIARRRRILAVALATGAGLVPVVAASADPAPATTPPTTDAADTTAAGDTTEPGTETTALAETTVAVTETTEVEATVPEVPAGVPIAVAQTTFTFADGPYHWASSHGSVLDSDGEVTLGEGTVAFLAATSGTLLVPQDAPEPFEVVAGTAIPRDERLSTTVSVAEGAPAGYVVIDIQAGAMATDPTEAPNTTTADTTAGTTADTTTDTTAETTADSTAETSADPVATDAGAPAAGSFTPGPGVRSVTLLWVVIEPGASFDAASIANEFGYVVVTKGVLDTADGETLYTYRTLELPGAAELTNASESASAEILVATIAPAGETAATETTTS